MYEQYAAEGILNHAYYVIVSGTRHLAPEAKAEIYNTVVDIVGTVVPADYESSVNAAFKKRLRFAAARAVEAKGADAMREALPI